VSNARRPPPHTLNDENRAIHHLISQPLQAEVGRAPSPAAGCSGPAEVPSRASGRTPTSLTSEGRPKQDAPRGRRQPAPGQARSREPRSVTKPPGPTLDASTRNDVLIGAREAGAGERRVAERCEARPSEPRPGRWWVPPSQAVGPGGRSCRQPLARRAARLRDGGRRLLVAAVVIADATGGL
jgi:hypothetical protein